MLTLWGPGDPAGFIQVMLHPLSGSASSSWQNGVGQSVVNAGA